MALLRTQSAAVFGIDAHIIEVELDLYASTGAWRRTRLRKRSFDFEGRAAARRDLCREFSSAC